MITTVTRFISLAFFPAMNPILNPLRRLVCLLLLTGICVAGVHASQPPAPEPPLQVTLAFGSQLTLDKEVGPDVTWTISRDGALVQSGSGDALLSYVFAQPGNYVVQINEHIVHDPMECGHTTLPAEIDVTVSSRKMVFDFEHATFSSSIATGSIAGLTLSVPVQVDSYDGSAFLFEMETVKSAGVGSNLTADPVIEELLLSPGTHTIQYTISGGVDRSTYVMFDFVDVNGVVQPFGITQEIH